MYNAIDMKSLMKSVSRLNCLEPAGIGNSMVEGITSYIPRLAQSHNLKPGTLVDEVIFPCMDKHYRSNLFFSCAHRLNIKSTISSDLINTLNKLTNRNDLSNLTLGLWDQVLCNQNLLRHNQAWCPYCYQEWSDTGKVIYQPLIWLLKDVNICPTHLSSLHDICPGCNHEIPILSRRSIPGFCSRCGTWLGLSEEPQICDKDKTNLQMWILQSFGDMLSVNPSLTEPIGLDNLSHNMSSLVQYLTKGNGYQFSRKSGFKYYNIKKWLKGDTPIASNLMLFSYCTNIQLADLITKQLEDRDFTNAQIRPIVQISRKFTEFNYRLAEKNLKKAIKDGTVSMSKFSEETGYGVETIKLHFPVLYKQLVDVHRDTMNNKWEEDSKTRLREIRETTIMLNEQGIYPSIKRLRSLLPGYWAFRNDSYDTWKNTLAELKQQNRLVS